MDGSSKRLNDLLGPDEMHASWQILNDIDTQVFWFILLVAITQWNAPGAPAAPFSTAGEHANGVEKLVRGISFPIGRFAASGHDDAGTIGGRRSPHPCPVPRWGVRV